MKNCCICGDNALIWCPECNDGSQILFPKARVKQWLRWMENCGCNGCCEIEEECHGCGFDSVIEEMQKVVE